MAHECLHPISVSWWQWEHRHDKENKLTIEPARPPAMNAKPMKRKTLAFHATLVPPPLENENESPRSAALSIKLILSK